MVLGAETPVNIREDCLVFVVYCAEDAAAYFLFPSRVMRGCSEKRGLSAFSTYLTQNHGIFNTLAFKRTKRCEGEKSKPRSSQSLQSSRKVLGASSTPGNSSDNSSLEEEGALFFNSPSSSLSNPNLINL
jgi:hypothetical protein